MNPHEKLIERIRLVRRRWRTQILVRGTALFLASAVALLILGVWGADLFGFKPAAVWILRVITGGTVFFVGWYFLYVPLRVRISDVRIAQFVEENYPQLEDRLVAAIEYGRPEAASNGMIDLLIRDALDKIRHVDFSVFLDRRRLAGFGLLGVAACLVLFALLTWGPSFFPYGFSHLYYPWTEASLGSPMMIHIVPGDIEIAKGSDQQIGAQLMGFDSPEVQLYLQPEEAETWNALAMEPDPRGSSFRYLLIDVRSSLRYYAAAKGVRSKTHSIRVLDLARVETIDLTYNFPAYTGMEPQVVKNEGDISALKGTRVELKVHLSRPAQSARLSFDNESTIDLIPSSTQDFTGSITLERSGSYVVEIAEKSGKHYDGSSEYFIDVIQDDAPRVTITRPMRDVRATNVEEVFSEIKAEDDIGIGKLELHYSVNGGPEEVVGLYGGKPPESSVTRSHTFFLEEFSLEPGDLISYYARAWDGNNVSGPVAASSDIYFIQIRPFEQKYIQNQQGGMQGAGGGEEGQEALSRQQKEIISATFKLIREKSNMDPKEYSDSLKSLALVQSRLQAQTQGLVERLERRGTAQAGENFGRLAEYLKNAVVEMEKAAVDLGAGKPESALPQEQKALQQLMRAESLFREIQISFSNQGGMGSGSQANAEDLADLFELELNKLQNQYETVQRGEQQQRDQKVDEALQRLKELAQRQQQLNERNRMLARQGGTPSSSGGSSQDQQQLMDEAEQLRRQLQRLSRERSSPQLSEAGSQLQKAIDEMKRALSDSRQGNQAEADARGMRALQQLQDVTRKLARGQQADLSRGLDEAVDESRRLVNEQGRIQEELEQLAQNLSESDSRDDMKQGGEDLVSRKTVLADRLNNLDGQIRDLSRQARRTETETSKKLAEAAGIIQDKRLAERIMSGNALIEYGFYEGQKQREDFIRDGLEDLNRQLESARNSLGQGGEGKIEDAANRARQLAEGLEAMEQRMQEMQRGQQGQAQSQQQGQQGQQGRGQQQGQGQQQARGQEGQLPGSIQDAQRSRGANQRSLKGGAPSSEMNVLGLSGDNIEAPAGAWGSREEYARQLQSEFKQRLMDAEDLRRLLDRNSTEMENLDKVIASLRRAGDYVNYDDPEQIARLRAAIDFMRQVELALARDLERLNPDDRYFFAQDNEAPIRYQKLVEEYFKSIAKSK